MRALTLLMLGHFYLLSQQLLFYLLFPLGTGWLSKGQEWLLPSLSLYFTILRVGALSVWGGY